MTVVLDASAILALILDEPGRERVAKALPDSVISAVNLAEVLTVLSDREQDDGSVAAVAAALRSITLEFSAAQAEATAGLRRKTRHKGLSTGDRASLALALSLQAGILTADRAWAGLDVGVEIEVIR